MATAEKSAFVRLCTELFMAGDVISFVAPFFVIVDDGGWGIDETTIQHQIIDKI